MNISASACQIVDQRRRRLAGLAPREMPGVVLDALAEAELVEHFEVETGALLDALRFDQTTFGVEEGDTFGEFALIASIARSTVSRGVT
jgi:hypothetical protein